MNYNLNNEAPAGSMKERAMVFINAMNSALPPRDRELLENLRIYGNARLRSIADEQLTPKFISPTGLPHDAVLLGRTAFVDRSTLRGILRDFTHPSAYTTRVLIVSGDGPCGKTYSWEFIRHLAICTGAIPQRLRLKDAGYTPRQFLDYSFQLLGIDTSEMPKMIDDPQEARIEPVMIWFKGRKLPTIAKPHWLVIDDLNDESVTKPVREAAYALAYCAEEAKANLWVALLGYNEPITDQELGQIGEEQPTFPDVQLVADHFMMIAARGPVPLERERARRRARSIFGRYSLIDKEAMMRIKKEIEEEDARLMRGQ